MTLQEISIKLDIPLASTYRLISALTAERYIVRSPHTKRCFVGPAAAELGQAARRNRHLLHFPPSALARAAAVTGETAFITEMIDDRAVCVSIVPSRSPFRLFVRLGGEMPLHAAASARTLLLDLTGEELNATLGACPMKAYRPRTPRSPLEVAERLKAIRYRGYDLCEDELDAEVLAISVPVRDDGGRLRWSVTIAAPKSRMHRSAIWDLSVGVLKEAAAALAGDLAPATVRGPAGLPLSY